MQGPNDCLVLYFYLTADIREFKKPGRRRRRRQRQSKNEQMTYNLPANLTIPYPNYLQTEYETQC